MNEKKYNKLVRDKIPEIIENDGQSAKIKILDNKEYLEKLDEKLLEECKEVMESKDTNSKIEEIADTLEVLYAIIDSLGTTRSKVEEVRLNKCEKRGAFKDKIFLESTTAKN